MFFYLVPQYATEPQKSNIFELHMTLEVYLRSFIDICTYCIGCSFKFLLEVGIEESRTIRQAAE
jgi:hypothetical protein